MVPIAPPRESRDRKRQLDCVIFPCRFHRNTPEASRPLAMLDLTAPGRESDAFAECWAPLVTSEACDVISSLWDYYVGEPQPARFPSRIISYGYFRIRRATTSRTRADVTIDARLDAISIISIDRYLEATEARRDEWIIPRCEYLFQSATRHDTVPRGNQSGYFLYTLTPRHRKLAMINSRSKLIELRLALSDLTVSLLAISALDDIRCDDDIQ